MAAAVLVRCTPRRTAARAAAARSPRCSAPLKHARVWRFSLYYVVVFGAYVALAAYLPKYYVDVYGLPLATAGFLTALFIFPASLLRPLGGWLSDRYGPRCVTYTVFVVMAAALAVLSVAGDAARPRRVGLHGTDVRGRVRDGDREGVGVQVHAGLLPAGRRGGRRAGRDARGARRVRPAAGVRRARAGAGSPQAAFVALLVLTLVSLGVAAPRRAADQGGMRGGPSGWRPSRSRRE